MVRTNGKLRVKLIWAVSITMLLIGGAGSSASWSRSNSTKQFKKGPFYTGKTRVAVSDKIGHLPVTFDERMDNSLQKEHFAALMDSMTRFLTGLNLTTALPQIALPIAEAPDIYVGNVNSVDAPAQIQIYDETRYMVLHTLGPSKKWRKDLEELTLADRVDYVLFITLGISEYLPRQKNLLGSKVLDLGTGNTPSLPWFSDLESSAEVLHLSGALLDRKGKILRAGAEGIIARPTRFGVSVLELEETFTDKDIERVLGDERREDIAGHPLKWQVALRNLIGQLLQRSDLIVASGAKSKPSGS